MPIIYFQKQLIREPDGDIKEFIIRDVNSAFETFFNISQKDVIGKAFDEVCSKVPRLNFINKDNVQANLSITIADNNNNIRYFDKLVFPSSEKDIIDVFCADKTDTYHLLLTTEKNLHLVESALDNLPVAAIIKDVSDNMKHIYWNKRASEMFNISAEEARNKSVNEILPSLSDSIRHDDQKLIKTGMPQNRTLSFVDHRGHKKDIVITNNYLSIHNEQQWIIYTAWDITALKQMQRDLIQAKERAEESNRLKSAFLANMSHEIRTPLNAIVGFSSLLAEEEKTAERREYLRIIVHNNNLLLKLINDILDLSKIEAGAVGSSYSRIDVNKLLYEIAQTSVLEVKSEKVVIKNALPLPEMFIETDQGKLVQVLSNFVNNTGKFTRKGEIVIGYMPPENEFVKFYVSDTGIGIPADKRKAIFERFTKLNSFEQGSGLGLSICQSIVEALGGEIGVESEEGKGSCFWFTLPVEH